MQTSKPKARRLILLEVEPIVFRRLKLLQSLHAIYLGAEETLALMQRLATDTCRLGDYEALIPIVRVHTMLSAAGWEAPWGVVTFDEMKRSEAVGTLVLTNTPQ